MCSDEVFLKHALELARASTNLCTPLHNQVMRLIKSRHADFWTMYRSVAKPFNTLETKEIVPSGANAISTPGYCAFYSLTMFRREHFTTVYGTEH